MGILTTSFLPEHYTLKYIESRSGQLPAGIEYELNEKFCTCTDLTSFFDIKNCHVSTYWGFRFVKAILLYKNCTVYLQIDKNQNDQGEWEY